MRILNIPIEPLEERYSIQWDTWFLDGFTTVADIAHIDTIYGEKSSGKINTGSFLDVLETNEYKTSQLLKIIQILKTYNNKEPLILFFQDLWFPGLANLAYIRDGMGFTNLRICGCLHAGSYDENDFLYKKGMAPWARPLENSMFVHITDMVFVATEYHKDLLTKQLFGQYSWKIQVTGFPIYPTEFVPKGIKKEKIIVFPHRLDEEKQPWLFSNLETRMREIYPSITKDWKFICSVNHVHNKQDYYHLLSRSYVAVSFALQETWGIAMQEATLCGAIPLVPNRLSYREMYRLEYTYTCEDDLMDKLYYLMRYFPAVQESILFEQQDKLMDSGGMAIPNIIAHITTNL